MQSMKGEFLICKRGLKIDLEGSVEVKWFPSFMFTKNTDILYMF